ncbi:sulfotransferase domain-containing protein [Roseobacter litoralis]|uniref:sulfotransferase domain-containing protein n=1 Tax=Roseobacter litoralis TaxID=42443 RepID=UPI002491313F|nr:sulfotransferase domain-containing protein [Roseobacter litoralis]
MTGDTENYVIIVGAMKSGTTTLFSMLADHPQIAPAHPKEPGFFAFDAIYGRGFEWYHGLFQFDPTKHRYRLEASTDYTKVPFVTGVWERMKKRPQARYKLIYIMRHPLRRLESHAQHVQRSKKEIGQNISPRQDHSFDNGISLASLAMTQYATQLDQYQEVIAAGDMFITTLEEITQAPGDVMDKIHSFLDLAPPASPTVARQSNAAKNKVKMHSSWRFLVNTPLLMAFGKRLLPAALRHRIKLFFRRSAVPEGRFRLTPQEETVLKDQLRPDLIRLGADYGIDVAGLWNLPVRVSDNEP